MKIEKNLVNPVKKFPPQAAKFSVFGGFDVGGSTCPQFFETGVSQIKYFANMG
jgi:hypothetical protein